MDHRFKKVEVRVKRNFVPILNLNLRSVYEMREEFEISEKPVRRQTYVANLIMFCDLIPI